MSKTCKTNYLLQVSYQLCCCRLSVSIFSSLHRLTVQVAGRGDWKEVMEVANNNKGLIFGVIVPVFLFFRFPAAVFAVGRVGLFAGNFIISSLILNGQVSSTVRWLWSRLVTLSLEKKRRGKSRSE